MCKMFIYSVLRWKEEEATLKQNTITSVLVEVGIPVEYKLKMLDKQNLKKDSQI